MMDGPVKATSEVQCCKLMLDHHQRNRIMGSVFVGDDQFDHESFGIGLFQEWFALVAVYASGDRGKQSPNFEEPYQDPVSVD